MTTGKTIAVTIQTCCQQSKGEKQRDSYKRNEEAEPKWKQHPVMDVSGGENKFNAVKNNIA